MSKNLVFGATNPMEKNPDNKKKFKKKYGLEKIEEDILKDNPEYRVLTKGISLTTLGLQLDSPDDIIENFGSPFDTECKLPFQVNIPKCYTKFNQQLDSARLAKLQDKTLIYIFYNYESVDFKLSVTKLLYEKDWSYNLIEQLWFKNVDFESKNKDMLYFNPKKWTEMEYPHPVRKTDFVKIEEFQEFQEFN